MTKMLSHMDQIYVTVYVATIATVTYLQQDLWTFSIGVATGIIISYGVRAWKIKK